ncbi:hypothetical protein [Fulvivirga lutimaris]|uniref:hypothetical protein n=1 Tax=Fulvivirga lutimaris TaxID=1819566 RepID=UPI0012BD5278|nr:hypothetical protein [Fulvivirga lutimaris]MTI39545.1 hypothetical protein [Fulvivirga lutimaris]
MFKGLALTTLLTILITNICWSQMSRMLPNLPLVEWSGKWKESALPDNEKLDLLSLLPDGDSVQFELETYDPLTAEEGDIRYFPFELSGLHYLDLDFDGDLDLIYDGQSGWQNLRDTKIYMQDNGQFEFLKILRGGILDIEKKESSWLVSTHWRPCCDSYTSRIITHEFSKGNEGVLKESISYVGSGWLKGLPDFSTSKSGSINDADLMATVNDFRGSHPYFREQNKTIHESLRAGNPIRLIHLPGDVKINILDKKQEGKETWYLVITEAISDVPKSIYEWSDGDNRRFIGWVKDVSID